MYKLGEGDSYPLAPNIAVIPAKAGIHCALISGPQSRSDLSVYVTTFESIHSMRSAGHPVLYGARREP